MTLVKLSSKSDLDVQQTHLKSMAQRKLVENIIHTAFNEYSKLKKKNIYKFVSFTVYSSTFQLDLVKISSEISFKKSPNSANFTDL